MPYLFWLYYYSIVFCYYVGNSNAYSRQQSRIPMKLLYIIVFETVEVFCTAVVFTFVIHGSVSVCLLAV